MTDQNQTGAPGGNTPGRPAGDRPKPDCQHWIGAENRRCRSGDQVDQYLTGWRCARHTPAAIAGRPEPQPGPGWPIHRTEAQE